MQAYRDLGTCLLQGSPGLLQRNNRHVSPRDDIGAAHVSRTLANSRLAPLVWVRIGTVFDVDPANRVRRILAARGPFCDIGEYPIHEQRQFLLTRKSCALRVLYFT